MSPSSHPALLPSRRSSSSFDYLNADLLLYLNFTLQHSTYQYYRPQPGPMGIAESGQYVVLDLPLPPPPANFLSDATDNRSETYIMLDSGSVLWQSPPKASSSSGTSSSRQEEKQVLEFPFSFTIPTLEAQQRSGFLLPPSFEGGSRSQSGEIGKGRAEGREVGRNACESRCRQPLVLYQHPV